MTFAPNTLNIYKDLQPGDQLAAIKKAGFDCVEFLFPYLAPVDEVGRLLRASGIRICLMDVLAGDVRNLDISVAIDPTRRDEFRQYAQLALTYARELNVPFLNCIAGTESAVPRATRYEMLAVYKENIAYICDLFAETDTRILVETVSEYQFPGYFLRDLPKAVEIIEELGRPNLGLLFDFFHIQLLHGNLLANVDRYWDRIEYFQIANPPNRNQPGVGEIDYPFVLGQLGERGYDGFVGLEYEPAGLEENWFSWLGK